VNRAVVPTVLALLAALLLAQCAPVYVNGAGATKPVALTSLDTDREYSAVGQFRRQVRVWYALWGLIPLSNPNVGLVAAQECGMGDAVINLRVTTQYDVLDCLLDAVLGCFTLTTRGVTVEGTVVKYRPRE
jgi:hypothetical protein